MTRPRVLGSLLAMMVLSLFSPGHAAPGPTPPTLPPLVFGKTDYLYRWSKGDQHEFTPAGQEDLQRWADMLTVNHYRNVADGEGLAGVANAVLENYKANRAIVVKTTSVPRTASAPAEHLIVVIFPRPDFIEAVFARLKLNAGMGTSIVYSHREYGRKIGDRMSAWLKENGAAKEQALMSLERVPEAAPVKD